MLHTITLISHALIGVLNPVIQIRYDYDKQRKNIIMLVTEPTKLVVYLILLFISTKVLGHNLLRKARPVS